MHLATSTPPAFIGEALHLFDNDARHNFSECTVIDTHSVAWQQAQPQSKLSILSKYSSAAYISSLSVPGACTALLAST